VPSGSELKVFLAGRVAIEAEGVVVGEERFPGRQGRLLFACLVAERGRAVPRDELAEVLWGEAPPATWEKALTVLMSKLRGLLAECGLDGAMALTSAFGCYRLDLPEGAWVDVIAAADAVAEAEAAFAADDLERTKEVGTRAASLARPSFLPGEEGAWVDAKRRELLDILRRALSCLAEASLRSGDEVEAVKWAEETIALEPYRETGYRHLMAAHAAAGNRGEALRVYERCRRLLATELGAYPSPKTESIYRELLGAPSPGPRAATFEAAPVPVLEREPGTMPARPLARRPLVAGATAIVLLGAIAAIVVLTRGGSNAAAAGIAANTIGFIDGTTGGVREEVKVERSPTSVAVGESAVWVTNANDATVSQIDPDTSGVRQTVSVGNSPSGVAVGRGSVWVANHADGTVSRINAGSSTVVQVIQVGNGPTAVAYGEDSVWVTNADERTVSRIDADTGVVIKTIRTDALGRGIAVGAGSVWVTDESTRTVVRIDASTNDVADTINVGNGPAGIAYGAAAIWVANSLDRTVSKIDPVTASVIAIVSVGVAPAAITVGEDAVWVSSEFGERVLELDPRSDPVRVASSLDVGNRPKGLAVSEEGVWVAVQASGRGHRGGRLTAFGGDYLHGLDPAAVGAPIDLITNGLLYDGLTSQRRTGGAEGTQLVPDLATNLPVPTNGGRTYTFRLRRGIRYSNGSQVRPEDFRRGLERAVIHGNYPRGDWKVVGAAECSVRRCDLSRGVVTTEDTVTIHLTTPNPRLSFWLTGVSPASPKTPLSIVPRGTPGTGPYMVESFVPDREITFVRNPKFHVWSGAARPDGYPDEILLRGGLSGEEAVDAVAAGRADLLLFGPPPDRVPELRTRYTSQLHLAPQSATTFLFLNTRREPFDDARVRRAVNFAVDRAEVARLHGGPELAQPTCQVIPPTVSGYVRFCPYTLDPDATGAWKAPDLERAQRLVGESGTRGAKVVVWTFPYFAKESHYLVSLLRRLGYRTRVKELPDIDTYFAAVSKTHPQAGLAGWFTVELPSGIFETLTCRLPSNWADFCDHSFDRAVQDLLRKQADDPAAAARIATRLDRRVVEAAPWVPLFTPRFTDFVSRRVGNYQTQPRNGVLLDQLWVR
jgi:YVTN family beta-propeller protein